MLFRLHGPSTNFIDHFNTKQRTNVNRTRATMEETALTNLMTSLARVMVATMDQHARGRVSILLSKSVMK